MECLWLPHEYRNQVHDTCGKYLFESGWITISSGSCPSVIIIVVWKYLAPIVAKIEWQQQPGGRFEEYVCECDYLRIFRLRDCVFYYLQDPNFTLHFTYWIIVCVQAQLHELYVRHTMNPFSQLRSPIQSSIFDKGIVQMAQSFNSLALEQISSVEGDYAVGGLKKNELVWM
mmetsp:Transcript_22130/g.48135  ORF Transcript_22130/g.48135 Transcript_22130/m.48135 type:complete len:172 (-) Transcript_22130:187-702(-)